MTTTDPTKPQALAATAPETAPTAPQGDEQAQTRGDSHTKPQTGSQGPLDGCAHAAAADSTGRPPRAPDPALVDGQRVLIEAEVCAGGTRIHTIRPQQFGKIVYLDLAEVVVHRDLPVQAVMDRIDATAAETMRRVDTIAAALNDGAPGWSQAMAATLARLRSQLAEAREALVRVAKALGWDVRPEQAPSGIPDLTIAVQQLRHERDQARAELAEARQQRDHAQRWNDEARRAWAVDSAELAVVRGELAAAREAYQRLAEAAQTVADALDAVATGGILDSAGHLRDLLARALAATAPETAPRAPQGDEQAQVRGESHTEPQAGSQGPLDLDAIRAAWLRVCGSCDAGYPTACTCPTADPRAIIAALAAELDQLRAEWSALRGQVGRAIVLCGPRGDKPIDVIVASVIDDLEEARQENADLRAQLAEARQERDQATEALAAAESERDAAREIIDDLRAVLALSPGQSLTKAVTQLRDDLDRLRRQVLAVAEDLERYASDPEGLPMSERKLAWTLRQIVVGERPEAPETAPESPQTDEQAQVRGESHTEPAGTVDDALHRIALHRIADHLGIPPLWISPAGTAWRVIAEIDRLRAERDALRAAYEPLLAQVTDWHTRLRAMWLPAAMGAVADLREEMGAALGATPDTKETR